jgi:hypothetical protein
VTDRELVKRSRPDITGVTRDRLHELAKVLGMNQSSVIALAIKRLHQQEIVTNGKEKQNGNRNA